MFRAIAHVLPDGVPDARLLRLDGSGHVTYAERPDQFATAVTTFVAGLARVPAES